VRRWARLATLAVLVAAGGCTSVTTRREKPGPDARPYPPRVHRTPTPDTARGGLGVGDSVVAIEVEGGTSMPAATTIRVSLAADLAALEIGAPGGLVVTGADGSEAARVPAGGSAAFSRAGAGVSVESRGPGGVTLSRTAVGAPAVARAADGTTVTLRGMAYRGDLLVQPGSGGLRAVNRLDLESYLLGVVPQEIGPVGAQSPEAVKAQAVAARTYAVKHLGSHSVQGYDVTASTSDQVYGGVAAELTAVSEGVRATRGEVLAYGGNPIDAFYHSTCGGRTAAIEEVWPQRPVPYLVSVRDVDPATGEAYDRISGRFRWTERWTGPELVAVLNRSLADSLRGRVIRQVDDVRLLERTASGRVRRLAIATDAGTFTVGGDRVRWILLTAASRAALNSSKFEVSVARDASGAVSVLTAEGMGWGHGIGMCQFGAIGRARAGQDYRTILSAYYPGTRLVRVY
jgi:stage II sporulation protein D